MFKQFVQTFNRLFMTPGAKALMIAMIALMALITFAELIVMHQFFGLIGDGKRVGASHGAMSPMHVYKNAAIFFALFMVTRAVHHWSRFFRVTAVKRGFAASEHKSGAGAAAWEWSLAFELSICFAAVAQSIITCLVFVLVVSPIVGLANVVIAAVVLMIIATIYRKNLGQQLTYMESKPTQDEVGSRLKQRLWDAEWGMAISSVAMAVALAFTLYETLKGHVAGHNAMFAFIGSRMLYGQLSNLSGSAMRFGRAIAKRGGPVSLFEEDDLEEEIEDAAKKEAAAGKKPLDAEAQMSRERRMNVLNQMLADGQNGRIEKVRATIAKLSNDDVLSDEELAAQQAAEAFAHFAAGPGEVSVPLMWTVRPLPGVSTDWLNPLILQHFAGSAVTYASPQSAAEYPHLVMSGRLGDRISNESITVGAGAMPSDKLPPQAIYVSLRGPLTAKLVPGTAPSRFGDPLVLASRTLPLRRKDTNGRVALVRHPEHLKTAVMLGDSIDEVSVLASRPDVIRALITSLLEYDGVATTSLPVVALCHSFGIPVAPITFSSPSDIQRFAYEDYALGLDIPIVLPHMVSPDLRFVRFDDLLGTADISSAKLDDIEDAMHTAVGYYVEQYQDVADPEDNALVG